jgi:hypothetical protein
VSYDLHLIRATPGATPEEIGALALAAAERGLPEDDPDPALEARKHALVAALRAANPALEPFAFGHAEIARLERTSEAEARRRHRHVELNGPDGGSGIQITLHDDWASLTLPHWPRGPAGDAAWDELWRYLRVLAEVGGFTVYDPQLERPLDLEADHPSAPGGDAEDAVAAARPGARAGGDSPRRRPWWKFW